MFRGRYEHSLDDKGCLSIPARFRQELGEGGGDGALVITNFDRCLAAYPMTEWLELERRLAALPRFEPAVLDFQRYFISGAVECVPDKAGRILLPAGLRQGAGIERDCILAGQISKIEIWADHAWQNEFDGLASRFSSMTRELSGLGISI